MIVGVYFIRKINNFLPFFNRHLLAKWLLKLKKKVTKITSTNVVSIFKIKDRPERVSKTLESVINVHMGTS